MDTNSLCITIAVVFLFSNCMESKSFHRCDAVPKYLNKKYTQLTRNRTQQGWNLTNTAIPWRNSSLRMYFNLSSLTPQTRLIEADIILYRGPAPFTQILIYQQSYRLILKDINSSIVLYNRTLASGYDEFCFVKNVLHLVQRWQRDPHSNQGLLLTVKDTGRYSTALERFYPKKNIYVPALALFINPGKIFNNRYKLIPSKVIQIIPIKT